MDMISAAGAVAALIGAAADGFVDTKYAFDKDGKARTVLGMSPGIFIGVVSAGLGLFGLGGSYSGLLVAGGVGVLAAESMRFVANKTAASMQHQGTAGLLSGGGGWQTPQMSSYASNGNSPRPFTSFELESVFDRVQGFRPSHQQAA